MYTHNIVDNKFLDKVRYNSSYCPFSYNFDSEANKKLLEQAKAEGVNISALNIISAGPFFHKKFFLPLGEELKELYRSISLSKLDLTELFAAFINNQYLLLQEKFGQYMTNKEVFSAFEVTNATFTLSDSPNNPQGFTANAEAFADHLSELLNYLLSPFCKEQQTKQLYSDSELYAYLTNLQSIINRYCGIKNHYETSLFYNGDIIINDGVELSFDSTLTELNASQITAITAIQNQRLKKSFLIQRRYNESPEIQRYFQGMIFKRTIDTVTQRGDFLMYNLRQTRESDVDSIIEYLIAGEDYYPFYMDEPLCKLGNLTISEIIRLHLELHNLASVHFSNIKFGQHGIVSLKNYKKLFLPRIKKSVLLSYLGKITQYSKSKLEAFIDLLTTVPRRGIDVYATPLVKQDDYFFFPFLPLARPNYYFLIDYWLGEAGIDLDQRGPLFEKHCKTKLKNIKQDHFNKFKVMPQSKFECGEESEEIDLLIETERSVIIAELKCVKYPMNERDHFITLSNVIASKACDQIIRKTNFLIANAPALSNSVNLTGKRIIKLVVTNFPVFAGTKVNDVPITDVVTFLSYFQTNKMTSIEEDLTSPIEKKDVAVYYNSEAEFCNNLEDYLCDNPLTKILSQNLTSYEGSYQFDKNIRIKYKTVIADPNQFNLNVNNSQTNKNEGML